MESLLRHIRACNNAVLPGNRLPFCIGESQVGWLDRQTLRALARFAPAMRVSDQGAMLDAAHPDALQDIARAITPELGLLWRNEPFDVRAETDGPVLAKLDRGAIPTFGVRAEGVHMNGLVRRPDGWWLWVARRAATRPLDPGKLDHLVAGGIPAGYGAAAALAKEAAEEAAIPPALLARARPAGRIAYALERPEGLRRDVLHCFDLELPEDFRPSAQDGEAQGFSLWPIARVAETVARTDDFKFNVNLVLIDLFLRLGVIDPDSAGGRALRAALEKGAAQASGGAAAIGISREPSPG